MHYRLLVTFNKDDAQNSEDARNHVYDELSNDGSFCGEGGRFNSPIADWFVIGGRWSGELTQSLLDKDKMAEFWKEFEAQQLGWTNATDKKEEDQKKKSEALFKKYFPDFKGSLPIWRDTYEHYGFEDDAMILTQELYDALLKPYVDDGDKAEYQNEGDHVFRNESWGLGNLVYTDLDYDESLSPDMIGKKWLV